MAPSILISGLKQQSPVVSALQTPAFKADKNYRLSASLARDIYRRRATDESSAVKEAAPSPLHCGSYHDDMLRIHHTVAATGLPNYRGARIPLPSNLALDHWDYLASKFGDPAVAEFLRYGFPVSYEGGCPDAAPGNHASATQHPRAIHAYTASETAHRAMLGLFQQPPFDWCQVNPLMARPKKGSTERRVIMDLSWPQPPLASVNSGTPKEKYLGEPYKLVLPTPADLCDRIREAGRGAFLYAADVARAYRQLPLDPADWPLTCMQTPEGYFVDISPPFGMRWAASFCQRVTQLVASALEDQGTSTLVYIDDFAGVAASQQQAAADFTSMQSLLS